MLGSENFAATKVLFVVFVEMFITLLYVVEVPALLPLEEGRAQNESRSKANFPSASQFCACEYTEYTFEFFFIILQENIRTGPRSPPTAGAFTSADQA